jgi:hypothetical protein
MNFLIQRGYRLNFLIFSKLFHHCVYYYGMIVTVIYVRSFSVD